MLQITLGWTCILAEGGGNTLRWSIPLTEAGFKMVRWSFWVTFLVNLKNCDGHGKIIINLSKTSLLFLFITVDTFISCPLHSYTWNLLSKLLWRTWTNTKQFFLSILQVLNFDAVPKNSTPENLGIIISMGMQLFKNVNSLLVVKFSLLKRMWQLARAPFLVYSCFGSFI